MPKTMTSCACGAAVRIDYAKGTRPGLVCSCERCLPYEKKDYPQPNALTAAQIA